MSYRIEYTGSLVDNRNLPEITANSSLTKQTTGSNVLPSEFEMNAPFGTAPAVFGWDNSIGNSGTSTNNYYSATTIYSGSGGFLGSTLNIDSLTATAGFDYSYFAVGANLLSGTSGQVINVQMRILPNTTRLRVSQVTSGGSFITIYDSNPSFPFLINSTFTSNGGNFWIYHSGQSNFQIDYIRVFPQTTTGVPVTPSTVQNGAQKTGGSLVNALGETIQSGNPTTLGPAKQTSLSVFDGTLKVAEARSFPSADNAQDSLNQVSDSKIITAQNTSLSVQANGTGAPEQIDSGSTVIIEDVSKLGENP